MNYEQALSYIHGMPKLGHQKNLEYMNRLLDRLGKPQRAFKCIHVAGTNGKGSVTAMIGNILISAGYKVGMFISPFLEEFTERIQIGLNPIPKEELCSITEQVKKEVDYLNGQGIYFNEFAIITSIGFVYFARHNVDFAVVEVGLGGRLDSTNVIDPMVSVITSISYDHMHILGNTLEAIAFEKAGIIKKSRPVVVYPQQEGVMSVISDVGRQRNAPIIPVDIKNIKEVSLEIEHQVFDFTFYDKIYKNIVLHLSGHHQVLNAATALTCIMLLQKQGIDIPDKAVYDGMAHVRWPGRLELVRRRPDIILDGAHNPSGAAVLSDAIRAYYKGRRIILIIGILKDKAVDDILSNVCPLGDYIIATAPDNPRALLPEELGHRAFKYCKNVVYIEGINLAIEKALEIATPEHLILICGSLYLVGEARSILKKYNE